MTDRPGVFVQQLEALSRGVEAIHDSFTYKVGALAALPPVLFVVLAVATLGAQASGLRGFDDLGSLLITGVGWLIVILVTLALTLTWASISIGIRAVRGYDQPTDGIYVLAAGRVVPVIGAVLLMLPVAVALFLLTLVLESMAGVAGLSLVAAALAIPLVVAWFGFVLTVLVGLSFVTSWAAAEPRLGPIGLLKKSLGLVLAYPAPTVVVLILATLISQLAFSIVVVAGFGAWALGVAPLLDAMISNGRTASAMLLGIGTGFGLFVVVWGPIAINPAVLADYVNRMKDTAEVDAAPTRLIGSGLLGVKKAVSAASAAAAAAREKAAEAAEKAAASQPPPQAPSPPPGVSDGPATPAHSSQQPGAPVSRFCRQCGIENPPGFRFCKSCGTPSEV